MGINSSQRKKDEQIKGQINERTKIRVVIENTHPLRGFLKEGHIFHKLESPPTSTFRLHSIFIE